LSKISGPLLDRIDLHVEVPSVPFTQLAELPPGAPSSDSRAQVLATRARQAERFGQDGPLVNGRMAPCQLRKFCRLKPEAMSILKAAMEELGLSARAHDKVLRVARTIADLEASDWIRRAKASGVHMPLQMAQTPGLTHHFSLGFLGFHEK
jgi:magnesium chelatase family protein